MCGLVGFNISCEERDRHSREEMFTALGNGLIANLHRGRDATGVFVASADADRDNNSFWWKVGSKADKVYDELMDDLAARVPWSPNIMAGHTRAKSGTFSEKDSMNNHPVIGKHVWTTHNGYIRNHFPLKATAETLLGTKYPAGKVDSLAISYLLDTIEDPFDEIKDIAAMLSSLEGGWAFHSYWETHPGLSLLVAGPQYPLTTVLLNGDKDIVYASEPEGLDVFLSSLSIDLDQVPDYREMDAGTFMMIHEGIPIYYGQYDESKNTYKKLKAKANPSAPDTKVHYRHFDPVLEKPFMFNKFRNGFDVKGKPLATSMDLKNPTLVYSKEHGLVIDDENEKLWKELLGWKWKNSNKPMPEKLEELLDERTLFETWIEADEVFATLVNNTTVLCYIWYGNVELVMTDTSTIIAVYDWSKSVSPRWSKPEPAKPSEEAKQALEEYTPLIDLSTKTFDKWWVDNSTPAQFSTKKGVVGTNDSDDDPKGNSKSSGRKHLQVVGGTKETTDGYKHYNYRSKAVGSYEYWSTQLRKADQCLNIFHKGDKWILPFNEQCAIHGTTFLAHPDTGLKACPEFVGSAMMYATHLISMNEWMANYGPTMFQAIWNTKTEFQVQCQHTHYEKLNEQYVVGDTIFVLPDIERCMQCRAERHVTKWPEFVEDFLFWYFMSPDEEEEYEELQESKEQMEKELAEIAKDSK